MAAGCGADDIGCGTGDHDDLRDTGSLKRAQETRKEGVARIAEWEGRLGAAHARRRAGREDNAAEHLPIMAQVAGCWLASATGDLFTIEVMR